MSPTNF